MSGGPWLRNMSVPAKTTITRSAPASRDYGHGVIIAMPRTLSTAGPLKVLKKLGIKLATKESPEQALCRLIETRARELPLPPAVAVTDRARYSDEWCMDILTIVTVLAKSSSRVYLRDKEPNLSSVFTGRTFVLLVPREVRL
jgi:hypothetical protein